MMKTSDSRYGRCMYFSSNALARKTEKLALSVWKKVDLSPSHAYLLMIVLAEPGVQPGALSEELHLSPSTITRLIERLEEKKLVIRATEGKMTNVYPTAKSKDMKQQLQDCAEEFQKNCILLLGKEETGRFVNSMNKMADKLPD
ncbi:MAG TPA: MarR family transcriptional regulator [Chitinophagaceae bacterium]|nr:MarR family transcriptional regulator [Chitinophagaceae bacterium]